MVGGGTNTWSKMILTILIKLILIKLSEDGLEDGVFYQTSGSPTDSRVLWLSGANAAQVSSV